MNTNTTNTATVENKVRKSMTRDPKIAHKIASRKVMNRAWDIAENAFKASCVDHVVIMKSTTQAKSKTEFFKESLSIAWKEHREDKEIYVKATMPKKNLQAVLDAYHTACSLNMIAQDIAIEVATVRYATNQTKLKMVISEINDFVYLENQTVLVA